MQTEDGVCFYGHYFRNVEDAYNAFLENYRKEIKDYPGGNPSHIGKIDYIAPEFAGLCQ